jgi:tetratricopeptide (TPR) repeat protein
MATALLTEPLDRKKAWEELGRASAVRHLAALEAPIVADQAEKAADEKPSHDLKALSASLVKSIRAGTVTIEEIDSFLQKSPQITLELREYFLSRKAWLLCRQDRIEEGLRWYDEALKAKEIPSTWALKGAALLQLARLDEAFAACEQAYLLRENFGPQKQGYLKDLLQGWSTAAALRGVFGISRQDSRELQKGVEEYLGVLDKARAEKLCDAATVLLKAEEPASVELQEVIEEWELAVRLLSIKDPFEGWRALAKEISKGWPEGVSAVDAIREQRE